MSWNPARVNPNQRHGNNPNLFARLKPGITIGLALVEADLLEKRFYDAAAAQTRTFIDRSGHKMDVSQRAARPRAARAPIKTRTGRRSWAS